MKCTTRVILALLNASRIIVVVIVTVNKYLNCLLLVRLNELFTKIEIKFFLPITLNTKTMPTK